MDVLKKAFNTFDVNQAQATQPADRDRILGACKADGCMSQMCMQLTALTLAAARVTAAAPWMPFAFRLCCDLMMLHTSKLD